MLMHTSGRLHKIASRFPVGCSGKRFVAAAYSGPIVKALVSPMPWLANPAEACLPPTSGLAGNSLRWGASMPEGACSAGWGIIQRVQPRPQPL